MAQMKIHCNADKVEYVMVMMVWIPAKVCKTGIPVVLALEFYPNMTTSQWAR